MPMRTAYGDASIIARAAIDASRAAIFFDRTGGRTRRDFGAGDPNGCGLTLLLLSTRNECGFCTPQAKKSSSLLVPYKTLARALGKALAKHSKAWLLCTSTIHKLTCQASVTIGSSKKAAGPPAWWWSGLALSAAVACGSEKFARTPLLLYIGASVAVVASRRLMAPNKRPPTPAETQTLDAIRVDLQVLLESSRPG